MRIIKVLTAMVAVATVIGGFPAAQASVPASKKPPQPTFSTTIKEGRKAVRQALKETKATSASVALVAGGKTVWSQTFGRVDKAGKKPSSTTRYGVGSVSKMITAMAVMQLVDEGKVSLDAPVVRYIPDFSMASPQYRQITVRMLLNHSAGLPGTDFADSFSHKPIPSYVDRLLAGLRTSHLKTTPGAMIVYCNDCFTLAGLVVERVSGKPFQDYVAKNILEPLGMNHSTYATSVPEPGTVAPVIRGGKVQPIEITNLFASGGLMSTSHDMARLARVFTGDGVVGGKRILSSSAVRQMAVDQTATTLRVGPPSGLRYGLGWDTVQDPALKSAGVLGWAKGGDSITDYHAGFVIAPDQGLAVVVEGAGTSLSSAGSKTIAQTVLLSALVETGAIEKMPRQVRDRPAKRRATRRDVEKMTGTYLAQNVTLKVKKAKNRSLRVAALTDGKWVDQLGRLEFRKGGAFWDTRTPGTSFRSVRAWGRTYLVRRDIGGTGTYFSDVPFGQRVRPGGPLSPPWRARVGKKWLLVNENPSSVWWTLATPAVNVATIPGVSGYLLAQGVLVQSVPFDATTSDAVGTMFVEVPGVGRDMYDFDFFMKGAEEFLSFSSSVLRPAATVPSLSTGSNAITIDSHGYIQWYRVPDAARLTISGQGDWKLFDDALVMVDSGGGEAVTRQAPAGSYLAVFGPAGSSATVVVE